MCWRVSNSLVNLLLRIRPVLALHPSHSLVKHRHRLILMLVHMLLSHSREANLLLVVRCCAVLFARAGCWTDVDVMCESLQQTRLKSQLWMTVMVASTLFWSLKTKSEREWLGVPTAESDLTFECGWFVFECTYVCVG